MDGTAGAWRGLDRQALEGCLGVVALALGVVMAGTGHLPTLKLLRGNTPPLTSHPYPVFLPYFSPSAQSLVSLLTHHCLLVSIALTGLQCAR